jgi:hypothetical protein
VMSCWETINPRRRPSDDIEYTLEGLQVDIVLSTSLKDDP